MPLELGRQRAGLAQALLLDAPLLAADLGEAEVGEEGDEGKDADESDRQKGPAERAVAPSPGRPGHATASREWSKSRKSRAQAITRGGRARKDGRPPGPEHLEMAEVRPGRPLGRFEGAPAVLSAAVGALVGAAPSPLPQPAVEHHLGAAAV